MTETDLRARADNGDIEALATLGKRLVAANDVERVREGFDYLRRAAEGGSGEALAQFAVFAAAGVGQDASWDRGLGLLARAASLGYAPARAELRLLAGATGDDFATMRKQVDVTALTQAHAKTSISDSPEITTISSFLSPAECSWTIERGRARLQRAGIYDLQTGAESVASARTNSKFEFTLADSDLVLLLINARIAATFGFSVRSFEQTNLLHYSPGEEFKPHFDFLDPANPGLTADLRARGQRVATALVYLNDGFTGGETDFPRVGYRFKGKTGEALYFRNVDSTGAPDPRTLHAGLAPTSGEKWLLSQWLRSSPV